MKSFCKKGCKCEMASLYKLSLQGVRAYAPDQPVKIEFFKPLTLIVGANGSGKTVCYSSFQSLQPACSRQS